jgi:hypothetical protein
MLSYKFTGLESLLIFSISVENTILDPMSIPDSLENGQLTYNM